MVSKSTRALRPEYYRERETQRQRECRARQRAAIKAIKERDGCSRCPERRVDALHFHHIDEATKCDTIQNAVASSMRPGKVREEIAKCEILCANCHAVEHAERRHAAAAKGAQR